MNLKRNIKTSICLCFICIFALNGTSHVEASAPEIAFSNISSYGGSDNDYFNAIVNLDDDGSIVVGYTNSTDLADITNSATRGMIVKYGINGNREWVKTCSKLNSRFLAADKGKDSGFFALASFTDKHVNGAVAKYDENGNEEWLNEIKGNGNTDLHSIKSTNDGGCVVVGKTYATDLGFTNKGNTDGFVVKYDSAGKQEWFSSYGGAKFDEFTSITELSDGNYVVIGQEFTTSLLKIVMMYDTTGKVITGKKIKIQDSFSAIVPTEDNGFVAVGYNGSNSMISKYDNSLNRVWTDTVSGNAATTFKGCFATEDDFVASGNSKSTNIGISNNGKSDCILVKYDKNGTRKWIEGVGGSDDEVFNDVAVTNKNKVIAVGNSKSSDWGFEAKGNYDAIRVVFSGPEPPSKPNVEKLANGKVSLTHPLSNTVPIDLLYRINGGAWINYSEPFVPKYIDKVCSIEAKAVGNTGLASEIELIEFVFGTEERDIDILFQQPNTLSVLFSNTVVDFGEVTGLTETEKNNALSIEVSSSLPYTLKAKALGDLAGQNDVTNIIDSSFLQIGSDSASYISLSKDFKDLLVNQPKGNNLSHYLNFKLDSTIGAKSDNYEMNLKMLVTQL